MNYGKELTRDEMRNIKAGVFKTGGGGCEHSNCEVDCDNGQTLCCTKSPLYGCSTNGPTLTCTVWKNGKNHKHTKSCSGQSVVS